MKITVVVALARKLVHLTYKHSLHAIAKTQRGQHNKPCAYKQSKSQLHQKRDAMKENYVDVVAQSTS